MGWLLIFGILLLAVPLHAERPARNNLDRMKQAADSTAVLCARRFHFRPGERIRWVDPEDADPLHQFILTRIAGALSWNGIQVTPSQDFQSREDRFILTVAKAGILYKRALSKGPDSKSSVERIAEVKVAGRFFQSDSVFVDTVSVRLEDRLRRSDLESVEQGGALLGRPERPRSGFLTRILEPMLLVASLGWMVYSFYSIRSQ